MDFVTVSDHNRIEGALDIAHLPDTFISVEVTTYFPEDGCKMHCLVCGITEAQFKEIDRLRENIYELREYFHQNEIVYSIAHPLFTVNSLLTPNHLEKLLLLFNRFEVINGTRHSRASDLFVAILDGLDSETINQWANRHSIEPHGDKPWEKFRTAGSDDHGGLFGASAYTETPDCRTVDEFINHLRRGEHSPGGQSGSSLMLGTSLYEIAYGYYKKNFLSDSKKDERLIGALFQSIATNAQVKQPRKLKLFGLEKLIAKARHRRFSAAEQQLVKDISSIFSDSAPGSSDSIEWSDTRDALEEQFDKICRVSQELSRVGVERFLEQFKKGYLIEGFQALSSLGFIGVAVAPYLAAFKTQHKDEWLHNAVTEHFPSTRHLAKRTGKRAWLTDTLSENNGVAHTIKTISAIALDHSQALTVVTVLPPFLRILHYLEKEGFDEVVISTPGPVGLCGRLAADFLGIKATGIYHTDFPKYVKNLTEDHQLEGLSWKMMEWFYNGMNRVFVPSEFHRNELISHGVEREKLNLLPRGVDTERFNPVNRNPEAFEEFGLNGEFKYLYVGSVSKDKNIESLLEAFKELEGKADEQALVVVGDGPHLEILKETYRQDKLVFTGALHGKDLAEAYASCDAFVFPSLTDTYGNVVLEAHASGLPAIVSDKGGPKEIVTSHVSGIVVKGAEVQELKAAMEQIRDNKPLYSELKEAALAKANDSGWDQVFEQI